MNCVLSPITHFVSTDQRSGRFTSSLPLPVHRPRTKTYSNHHLGPGDIDSSILSSLPQSRCQTFSRYNRYDNVQRITFVNASSKEPQLKTIHVRETRLDKNIDNRCFVGERRKMDVTSDDSVSTDDSSYSDTESLSSVDDAETDKERLGHILTKTRSFQNLAPLEEILDDVDPTACRFLNDSVKKAIVAQSSDRSNETSDARDLSESTDESTSRRESTHSLVRKQESKNVSEVTDALTELKDAEVLECDVLHSTSRLDQKLRFLERETWKMRRDLEVLMENYQTVDSRTSIVSNDVTEAAQLMSDLRDVRVLDEMITILESQLERISIRHWLHNNDTTGSDVSRNGISL